LPDDSGVYSVPPEVARDVPTQNANDPDFDPRASVRAWLEEFVSAGNERWRIVVRALLRSRSGPRIVELGDAYYAATWHRLTSAEMESQLHASDTASDIVGDDDDGASYIGAEVTLERHLKDVERWVRAFGVNLGLPR